MNPQGQQPNPSAPQQPDIPPISPEGQIPPQSSPQPQPMQQPAQPQQPMQQHPQSMPGQGPMPQQGGKTNTLAIVSIVMAFIFWPAALVTGFISLGQIKKTGESGKTLALVGIILSGISAVVTLLFIVIVIANFAGVQEAARDVERRLDVEVISVELDSEALNNNGLYPSEVNSSTLSRIDPAALVGPDGESYQYSALPAGCTDRCTGYSISATLEDGSQYTLTGGR